MFGEIKMFNKQIGAKLKVVVVRFDVARGRAVWQSENFCVAEPAWPDLINHDVAFRPLIKIIIEPSCRLLSSWRD